MWGIPSTVARPPAAPLLCGGSRGAPRLGLLLLPLLLLSPGRPAQAQLALEFAPDTLFVQPDRPARAFLTLRNNGASPLTLLDHEWLVAEGMAAMLEAPLPDALGPGATTVLRVSLEGGSPPGGSRVLLRLGYRSGELSSATVASLRIAPRPAPAAADVVAIEVVGSLASLSDDDEGRIYLRVENRSDHPVTVDSVVTVGPPFLEFLPTAPVELPARRSRLIRVDLAAKDWVRPGTHTTFFVTHLRWSEPDGPRAGNLILAHDVPVGVAGASEILKVFSLPSFLLLPGFLMVVTFGMVGKLRGREPGIAVEPKDVRFWVLAVSLSLLWVFVYPQLPGGRNFLRGYGMADVAWVWFWSIVLGALTAVVLTGIQARLAAREAARVAARAPSADDSETLTLRKLALRGRSLELPEVEFPLGRNTVRGFVLEEENGACWIAPAIRYQWRPEASQAQRDALEADLKAQDPGRVAKRLEELLQQRALQLYWKQGDHFGAPLRFEGRPTPRAAGDFVAEDVPGG